MDEVEVYLDVDGVINALGRGRSPWPEGSLRQRRINGFIITWSTDLIDRLNALAARPHVHFHWLTTWLSDAPQMLAPQIRLDGADWPVVGADHHETVAYPDWWKLHAIREVISEDRRAVWIDDDLYEPKAKDWALTLGDRIMVVQPDPRVGIGPDMMSMIEEWIGG